MKKFKFNLEKVLEVRQIEEELAQNRLFQARQRAEEIEKQLTRLEDLQKGLYSFLRGEKELSVAENIQARNYMYINRRKIAETEESFLSQEREVARCREDFLDRRRKREVLEKLKEKEFKRYHRKLLYKEQKELDEIGQRAGDLQRV
ncbi:MAG: flagellar protein FliJ [Halanaerobiales bacterium]|nr:flagellar protein FliJ [Halanaerobiales bacterium]